MKKYNYLNEAREKNTPLDEQKVIEYVRTWLKDVDECDSRGDVQWAIAKLQIEMFELQQMLDDEGSL